MKRALLLLVVVAGCRVADYPRYDDDPVLVLGRSKLLARCSSCHALPDPKEETAEAWPETLEDMAPKAKLTEEEAKAVESYLLRASREP
jgi:hypothetical protein